MICSICEREFNPEDEGVRMPFCSKRCWKIDQQRWVSEEYGLPYENIDDLELKNVLDPLDRRHEETD